MNMSERMHRAWRGMRLVWLGASVPLLLLFCTASNAQPRREGDTQTVTGVVKEMTTAPKGEVDGAVLDDGTVIHWPPHLADRFTAIVARGDRIRVLGWMETGPRGDTKLEVRTVTNLRTNAARQNDDEPPPPPRGRRPAPPPPPPPARDQRETRTVTGEVREMTKAPMGEVDGAILDDDTVIHWPPHLADRFTAIVAKGNKIRVTGWMEKTPMGDTHLEVRTVTNLRTKASRETEAAPPPPPDPRREARDRPADPEQRIRDLENQVEQLRKELERLRRNK